MCFRPLHRWWVTSEQNTRGLRNSELSVTLTEGTNNSTALLKREKVHISCWPLDSQLLVAHLLHWEHDLLLHALSQFEVVLVSVLRHWTVQRKRTSVITHNFTLMQSAAVLWWWWLYNLFYFMLTVVVQISSRSLGGNKTSAGQFYFNDFVYL